MQQYNEIELQITDAKRSNGETIDFQTEPGSKIIGVFGQAKSINVYYHFNPYRKGKKQERRFIILSTGSRFQTNNNLKFIDSTFLDGKVIHVYEMI